MGPIDQVRRLTEILKAGKGLLKGASARAQREELANTDKDAIKNDHPPVRQWIIYREPLQHRPQPDGNRQGDRARHDHAHATKRIAAADTMGKGRTDQQHAQQREHDARTGTRKNNRQQQQQGHGAIHKRAMPVGCCIILDALAEAPPLLGSARLTTEGGHE